MRAAAIDIGTNSVLLLIAERDAQGAIVAVHERATITRLGEGVDRTRALNPAAVARTMACLADYADTVHAAAVERVAVVGTSAMRDAGGSEPLRALVRARFGVDVQVISGQDEASLTFEGALSGLGYEGRSAVVFDIGGGSTEIVRGVAGGTLTFATSIDIGSVRLTERHIVSDPPSPAELAAVDTDARRALAALPPDLKVAEPVGIAGTMTTLAAVAMGLTPYNGARVHGSCLCVETLRRVTENLAGLSLEARKRCPGMEPKRADVVVAGGVLALALLEFFGAEGVRVSDRGVRWGLARRLLVP